MHSSKFRFAVALSLLLLGLVARAWLALEYPSVYWGDGIFQVLEPAHEAVFGYGITPMEFKEGLRSWIFPGMVAGLMWLSEPLGAGSWGYLAVVTIALSALSLVPAVVAWRWAERREGLAWTPLLAIIPPLVWTELVYFGPKALYEVFTAHLFVLGLFWLRFADETWLRPVLAGLLFGICFINRPHLGPSIAAVGGVVLVTCDDRYRRFSWMIVGLALGVAIGGAVDALTWDVPFHSMIANSYHNLIQDKASRWGTSPFWQYPVWIWRVSPIGALLLGGGLLAGIVRRPFLAWPAAMVLLAHSGIPHKEYRFIYPAIVMATVILGVESSNVVDVLHERFRRRAVTIGGAAALSTIVLAVSVTAGLQFDLRSRGMEGETTNWRFHRGGLLAFRSLSTRPDLCGVGLFQFDWGRWSSGGYTYLHRDVPIVMLDNEAQLRQRSALYDVVVAEGWPRERTRIDSFELERCFQETCLLTRPGSCEPSDRLPIER